MTTSLEVPKDIEACVEEISIEPAESVNPEVDIVQPDRVWLPEPIYKRLE